jgi:hypothetical protein
MFALASDPRGKMPAWKLERPASSPRMSKIVIEPRQMAGVWANVVNITRSEHEFTLDFIRMDHSAQPPCGIVVARVAFSPLLASRLADLLMETWQQYAHGELLEGQDDGPASEEPEDPEA